MKYLLVTLIIFSNSAKAQYFENFSVFPDTLEHVSLKEAGCAQEDYRSYSVCPEGMVSWDEEKALWVSEDGSVLVSEYSRGLSEIEILRRTKDGSIITFNVEINISEPKYLEIIQPDAEHYPELIQFNCQSAVGGAEGSLSESYSEIWNTSSLERIAKYSNDFHLVEREESENGNVKKGKAQIFSREVEFADGRLMFSVGQQIHHSSLNDEKKPENNSEKSDTTYCQAYEYLYLNGRFVKSDSINQVLFEAEPLTFMQAIDNQTQIDPNEPEEITRLEGKVKIYERNDSTLLRLYFEKEAKEYLAPSWVGWISRTFSLESVQQIEDSTDLDLLVFEISDFENLASSVSATWYRSSIYCIIIDLNTKAVVFDYRISENYCEQEYSYSGDIYDETKTDEELSALYDSRDTTITECRINYEIVIKDERLVVMKTKEIGSEYDMSEGQFPPEGIFTWNGKEFTKLD
ncbi:MAG: hypothetical protein AAGC47_12180 [Bacteroidota bacterium]